MMGLGAILVAARLARFGAEAGWTDDGLRVDCAIHGYLLCFRMTSA